MQYEKIWKQKVNIKQALQWKKWDMAYAAHESSKKPGPNEKYKKVNKKGF